MCTHKMAARQCRMIAGNEAFSIEVIKMIEDSGKLIHLWARWWGTLYVCVGVRGCVCVCEGVCEKKCLHGSMYMWDYMCLCACIVYEEQVVKWDWHGCIQWYVERCPREDRVVSQHFWYHHPTLAYNVSFNLTFIRTK